MRPWDELAQGCQSDIIALGSADWTPPEEAHSKGVNTELLVLKYWWGKTTSHQNPLGGLVKDIFTLL